MEQQLFDFLGNLFSGTLWIMEKLFSGIPLAKEAILWMIVVMLVMNLIVLPIRGFGASDRAFAKEVRAGRADSTRAVREQKARSKQMSDAAYQRFVNRERQRIGPERPMSRRF